MPTLIIANSTAPAPLLKSIRQHSSWPKYPGPDFSRATPFALMGGQFLLCRESSLSWINLLVKIAIIGLGYVGLPLALQFARCGTRVLGLDIDPAKVKACNAGQSY